MDDMFASGLVGMLREIEKIVESCVTIKHTANFPAGETITFEHLRPERILKAKGVMCEPTISTIGKDMHDFSLGIFVMNYLVRMCIFFVQMLSEHSSV